MTTNHSKMIPKPHFMETAAEYIEKYENRLKMWREELAATEAEPFEFKEWNFIVEELQEIEAPFDLLDLARTDPDPGITPRYDSNENYQAACYAIHHIGYKKAYYANKKKIAFLYQRPAWQSMIQGLKALPINKIDGEPKTVPESEPQNKGGADPEPLIDPAKLDTLLRWEQNISAQVLRWKAGQGVELCAAFCNYLLSKRMFTTNKNKTAIAFALSRYGLNINSSLDKLTRAANEELLKRKTDTIVRLITETRYGKL